jgi:ketosteroid isomerase-like protein
MKNLMKIGFVLVFSAFMFSCGGGSSDDPQAVAKDFLTALSDEDYEKAKELGTENTVQMLGLIESMAGMAPEGEDMDMSTDMDAIEWGETEIDGDKAVVHYTAEGNKEKLDMVKVDGKWKVDMKKEM